MTDITGKFQPWVPNYGYHSWTLKGKRDKELMEYLVKRNTDGRFVSNDYSLPTSEDIRVDPEKPFVKDTLDEILEHVRTIHDKLSIMKSNFVQRCGVKLTIKVALLPCINTRTVLHLCIMLMPPKIVAC